MRDLRLVNDNKGIEFEGMAYIYKTKAEAKKIINDIETEPWVWAANSKDKLEKRKVALGEYDPAMDTYVIESGITSDDYIAFPDETLTAGAPVVKYDDSMFASDDYYGGEEDFYGDEGQLDGGEENFYGEDDAVFEAEPEIGG